MNKPDYSDKNSVREYFLTKRGELNTDQLIKNSNRIYARLENTTIFQQAKSVHTYVSIEKNNEVLTQRMIKHSMAEGKKIIVPKMFQEGELEHIRINSLNELKANSWGVPEPVHKKTYPISDIDLVIVPMVAGDRLKNRIGYGKGYYDRFLSNVDVEKIGLLFHCQLSEYQLPVESFDIKLDVLITENEVIS